MLGRIDCAYRKLHSVVRVSPGMVRIQGSTANIKATLPKSPKRISLNVNHDILAAEATVKKQ